MTSCRICAPPNLCFCRFAILHCRFTKSCHQAPHTECRKHYFSLSRWYREASSALFVYGLSWLRLSPGAQSQGRNTGWRDSYMSLARESSSGPGPLSAGPARSCPKMVAESPAKAKPGRGARVWLHLQKLSHPEPAPFLMRHLQAPASSRVTSADPRNTKAQRR